MANAQHKIVNDTFGTCASVSLACVVSRTKTSHATANCVSAVVEEIIINITAHAPSL